MTESKNKWTSRILILCVSLLVCAASIVGGELDYAGNDDTFRNLVSVGAFGRGGDFYIPFSNVLYGIPIFLFNTILPGINWYYWIMVVLSAVSIAALCMVVFEKSDLPVALLGTMVINLILSRDYYVAVQFTKVASLWVVCGIALVFASLMKRDKTWILGTILFAIGGACRMDCVYMAVPFAGVLAFVSLLKVRDKWSREGFFCILKRCIWILVAVVVLLTSETLYRRVNPEWQEYWTYNRSLVPLLDQTGLDYTVNPEEFDLLNTDQNDLNLMGAWEFGDTEFFSQEWVDRVNEIGAEYNDNGMKITPAILAATVRNMASAGERGQLCGTLVIILSYLMIVVLLVMGDAIDRLFALGNLFCIYVIYWYFTCYNRFMWRAELGSYVAIIAFSAVYFRFFMSGEKSPGFVRGKAFRIASAVLSLALLMGYSGLMVYNWRYVKDKQMVAQEADISGRLYRFKESPENFYVLSDFFVSNNPAKITAAKFRGAYENSVYLGNWIIPSPDGMYYAGKRGIDNPMLALTQENVYLHATREDIPEMVRAHLEKVTGRSIEAVQVEDELWRFE